jgi:hypothetical protein
MILIFSWLFLGIHSLVVAAFVFILFRRHYRREIESQLAVMADLGKMCKELSDAKGDADKAHRERQSETEQEYRDVIFIKERENERLLRELQKSKDREERIAFHAHAIRSLWSANMSNRSGSEIKRLADLEHERMVNHAGYRTESEAERLSDLASKMVISALAKGDTES